MAFEREIREEAGETLEYEIIGIVDIEAIGQPENRTMMQGFLVLYRGGDIVLSDEHSEYQWLSPEEVQKAEDYRPWVKRFVETAAKAYEQSQYLNDVKRLQADFENYKKRVKNDERELYGHLSAQIVTELIPVLDNFHAATEHVPADQSTSPWVTGITYIEQQFEAVLRNYGVEPLEVKPGDTFDPARHEALDHKTSEGEENKLLKIEKVVQKGYQIKGKLVRPAKVIVS
jgi:molecular chaperone GrpE